MKPLLVIGSQGQLARAFKASSPDAIFLNRDEADLAKPEQVVEALKCHEPRAIVNAAAYTQVDQAENEEELATLVNGETPAAIARYCAQTNIPFMHFSTDYVFDGAGDKPHKEDEAPRPLNAYGRSKLAGERGIAEAGGRYLIFRTSWVYGAKGKNFLNTILRLAAEREELRVIDDQHGAPTYSRHLARAALAALDKAETNTRFPAGLYHLCNAGETSWHGFACAIIEHARKMGLPVKAGEVHAIPSSAYPLPAARPLNSRLDCTKAQSMFGVSLRPWQDGLSECMERKK